MGSHGDANGNSMPEGAPRFSVAYMDRSLDPYKDFFGYADGKWVDSHPLPPDKARFSAFDELTDWNLLQLKKIAEECASGTAATQSREYARIVGDFYTSAMDTARIEQLGFASLEDVWERISNARSKQEIIGMLPYLHLAGINAFFGVFSSADEKNSSVYALYLYQGGLSLPDRDYYLLDTDEFKAIRDGFRSHMSKMFLLKGMPETKAAAMADAVFRIEAGLARSSRERADLRDAEKNYNMMGIAELDKRYGGLPGSSYLKDIGVNGTDYVVVGQPEFFDALTKQFDRVEIGDLKVYLQWHTLHAYAPYLHSAAEQENFDFFRRKLKGQQQPEERWKVSIRVIDDSIGEALGKLYVEQHFGEAARSLMGKMVGDIISVFRDKLRRASWMSEATRLRAEGKLDRFSTKIGYPVKFRDYSSLLIVRTDYAGNVRRSAEFELKRQAVRAGKPVNKDEWGMTPPSVNAYYSPAENQIVFPAGILQPPFFDPEMDPAVNYGGIGTVISHEISHGFDDNGRKYDESGNLKNWWQRSDEEEFNKRARAVENRYGAQEALPGRFINGKLTLGENIADLGGVSIAYEALQKRLEAEPSARKRIDGFSQEQRFFISWAQIWRIVISKEEAMRLLTIDPHSPGKYRAIIPAVSHPAFGDAFPNAGLQYQHIGIW